MAQGHTARSVASRDACTGVATTFTIISFLIVALRLYTRSVYLRKPGTDDYAMVAALIFTIGYLACIWVIRFAGMGLSGTVLSVRQMEDQLKAVVAIEVIYYLSVFLIKLSICFCYLRIAAVKSFERMTKYTIYFVSVFCGICIICTLAQCVPLHKLWDFTGTVQGTCINTTALFYATSSINILTDFWILFLPVRTLLKIQRPQHEKLALIVVFSLGVFSCIASIVRLHSIHIYTESDDPFYDSVPVNLWSMVEVNIGIWCASIPALKALVSRNQREARSHKKTAASSMYRDSKYANGTRLSVDEVVPCNEPTSPTDDGRRGADSGFGMMSLGSKRASEDGTVQAPDHVARKNSNAGSSVWTDPESEVDLYRLPADERV
ncbi:unnamed protein product [Periconia digitata]|uniref:Rhodopsin domain-containing protein n=1 Tax=Periconia digitata TaxID=1303443 RepID=A0A9W4XTR2_9PLEO|nr:unnamed protein product [Periconia digitata]